VGRNELRESEKDLCAKGNTTTQERVYRRP
jgi:hypothetical protein